MSLTAGAQRASYRPLFLLILLPLLSLALTLQTAAATDKQGTKSPEQQAADQKKEEPLPLKPARKVQFTTDEGTWLSLDVSPPPLGARAMA